MVLIYIIYILYILVIIFFTFVNIFAILLPNLFVSLPQQKPNE